MVAQKIVYNTCKTKTCINRYPNLRCNSMYTSKDQILYETKNLFLFNSFNTEDCAKLLSEHWKKKLQNLCLHFKTIVKTIAYTHWPNVLVEHVH